MMKKAPAGLILFFLVFGGGSNLLAQEYERVEIAMHHKGEVVILHGLVSVSDPNYSSISLNPPDNDNFLYLDKDGTRVLINMLKRGIMVMDSLHRAGTEGQEVKLGTINFKTSFTWRKKTYPVNGTLRVDVDTLELDEGASFEVIRMDFGTLTGKDPDIKKGELTLEPFYYGMNTAMEVIEKLEEYLQ
jgi:hypothetical protein